MHSGDEMAIWATIAANWQFEHLWWQTADLSTCSGELVIWSIYSDKLAIWPIWRIALSLRAIAILFWFCGHSSFLVDLGFTLAYWNGGGESFGYSSGKWYRRRWWRWLCGISGCTMMIMNHNLFTCHINRLIFLLYRSLMLIGHISKLIDHRLMLTCHHA